MFIESVEQPRQRLEDFFMNIVEQARADHLANAGAGQGGPTAEFLRGSEAVEGEDLIDQLSQGDDASARELPQERKRGDAAAANTGPSDSVLNELLEDAKSPEAASAAVQKPEREDTPSEQVDSSVIDGLLGDGPDEGSSRESKD